MDSVLLHRREMAVSLKMGRNNIPFKVLRED